MRNTWLIALREFKIKVRSRGFIISSLLVPVMLIAFLIFGNTSSQGVMPVEPEPAPVREEEQSPLGLSGGELAYVDQAGFIHSVPASLAGVDIRAYPDVGAANQDLERGEIDAYYLIPPDYLSSGEIQRVSLDLPKSMPDSYLINYLLLENLFTEAAPEERARFVNPFVDSGSGMRLFRIFLLPKEMKHPHQGAR
jgi:ABC-2 type transport system permease protein